MTVEDMLITALADAEAVLLARVADLKLEVRVWRDIAQHPIHRLHERELDINRCRAQERLLRAAYGRLRAKHVLESAE